MTIGKFIRRSVLPILLFAFLYYIGRDIYIVDGKIDYFRAMLVYGIPFGIPYMFTVIPIGGDVAVCVGILLLNAVVGAIFGFVIAVGILLRAMWGIITLPVYLIRKEKNVL